MVNNTKIILIYGAPAVGKLTVAEKLTQKTGYKLFHNHLTTDLVQAIFERGNSIGDTIITKLRFELLELAIKERVSGIVMTTAYAPEYVHSNGKTDEWYISELENITIKNGGDFYGVHLIAEKETLLKRVTENSRSKYGKLVDKKIMEELTNKYDFTKSIKTSNSLIINNDNLTPEKVSDLIKDKFNL